MKSRPPIRFFLLAVATAIIAWKISCSVSGYIQELKTAVSLSLEYPINGLIFFETFLFLLLIIGILFLLLLFTGEPGVPGRALSKWRDRPIRVFIVTATVISFVLVLLPMILLRLFHRFDFCNAPEGFFGGAWPNPSYRIAALWTALALGLSVADTAASNGLLLLMPLLAVFVQPRLFTYEAVLLWNAAARWMPSRYWKVWRPVCLILTLITPLAAFFCYPPFMRGTPLFGGSFRVEAAIRPGGCDLSYEALVIPGKGDEILMGSNNHVVRLKADDADTWQMIGKGRVDDTWVFAGMDHRRDLLYFYFGKAGLLEVLRLDSLEEVRRAEIPVSVYPDRDFFQYVYYIPTNDGILLASRGGNIVMLDAESLTVRDSNYVPPSETIWSLIVDEEKGELLVLQNSRITVFRIDDLVMLRIAELPQAGYWMIYDRNHDRLLVSEPQNFRIVAYDRTTFDIRGVCDAPAGVRAMAVDPNRQYLFAGSAGGAMEIRSLADFRLISRVRLKPMAHWIEPMPDVGQAFVSNSDLAPYFLRYDPPPAPFDPADRVLQLVEKAARFYLERYRGLSKTGGARVISGDQLHPAQKGKTPGPKTILYAEKDDDVFGIGRAMLERAGFVVLRAADNEEVLSKWKELPSGIDFVILDASAAMPPEKEFLDRLNAEIPRKKCAFGFPVNEKDLKTLWKFPCPVLPEPFSLETATQIKNRLNLHASMSNHK